MQRYNAKPRHHRFEQTADRFDPKTCLALLPSLFGGDAHSVPFGPKGGLDLVRHRVGGRHHLGGHHGGNRDGLVLDEREPT